MRGAVNLAEKTWKDAVRHADERQLTEKRARIDSLFARIAIVAGNDVHQFLLGRTLANAGVGDGAAKREATQFARELGEKVARLVNEGRVPSVPFADQSARLKSETFYEPLDADERLTIFNALRDDVGSAVGSYGGHWYECPNGHPYAIADCGGAMSESTCPECGAAIGGGRHRLRDDNAVSRDFAHLQEGAVDLDLDDL